MSLCVRSSVSSAVVPHLVNYTQKTGCLTLQHFPTNNNQQMQVVQRQNLKLYRVITSAQKTPIRDKTRTSTTNERTARSTQMRTPTPRASRTSKGRASQQGLTHTRATRLHRWRHSSAMAPRVAGKNSIFYALRGLSFPPPMYWLMS